MKIEDTSDKLFDNIVLMNLHVEFFMMIIKLIKERWCLGLNWIIYDLLLVVFCPVL